MDWDKIFTGKFCAGVALFLTGCLLSLTKQHNTAILFNVTSIVVFILDHFDKRS